MSLIGKLKPPFWDHEDSASDPFSDDGFSFRRKWKLMVLLTTVIALTPLAVMTFMDYQLTSRAIVSDVRMDMVRAVSNTWRTISFSLKQQQSALAFIAHDNAFDDLCRDDRIAQVLKHLKRSIGGFEDIALIDSRGRVRAYAGPHDWKGRDLCRDACFRQVLKAKFYVGDPIREGSDSRQLVIALRHDLSDGSFFVLRSAINTDQLYLPISQLEIDPGDDVFIVDQEGVLQTPSRRHGGRTARYRPPSTSAGFGSRVIDTVDASGTAVLIGYAAIPETAFTLMLIKPKSDIMDLWFRPRIRLIGFLIASIALIMLAILGSVTFLVNRIHIADRKRVAMLHQVEYTNKLASIGRLASGVAHEINNPLAIINQKSGLIKDLFTLRDDYAGDERLIREIGAIIEAVKRCGAITQRLLNFAQHMESDVQRFNLVEVIKEVLGFLGKEAEKRRVHIRIEAPDAGWDITADRGSLQQILLNLFNNAFAAMADGGHLVVTVRRAGGHTVTLAVEDDGCGIPPEDIKRVFEPFFSSRSVQTGTGLGLSITYGLVKEMGGEIAVESRLGKGTRFTITLPSERPESAPKAPAQGN